MQKHQDDFLCEGYKPPVDPPKMVEKVCCVVKCRQTFNTHSGKANYYIDMCDDCLLQCSTTEPDDDANPSHSSTNIGDDCESIISASAISSVIGSSSNSEFVAVDNNDNNNSNNNGESVVAFSTTTTGASVEENLVIGYSHGNDESVGKIGNNLSEDVVADDVTVISNKEHVDVDMDITMELARIAQSQEKAGPIHVGGVMHFLKFENDLNLQSRGGNTYVYHNSKTENLPQLYWYKPYFALLGGASKARTAGMRRRWFTGYCMTTCGNITVCILETRCNRPHYDICLYLPQKKECVIVRQTSHYYKLVCLCPNMPLTVSEQKIDE